MPLMQHVLTLLVATHALVIQASLEMGGHVVCYNTAEPLYIGHFGKKFVKK